MPPRRWVATGEVQSLRLASRPGAPLRLLVTGNPGVGKTTLCKTVYKRLCAVPGKEAYNLRISGFLGQERRNKGKRIGFDMISLDESELAPLADEEGPATGYRVGKYHVQLKQFEDLTFPILDKALGKSESGNGPRAVIFDEIGKMELFSTGFIDRVRRLLTSEDVDLHVLGTVAVRGDRFIAESKSLPGVEVCTIEHYNRDTACEEVFAHFAKALAAAVPSSPPRSSYYSKSVLSARSTSHDAGANASRNTKRAASEVLETGCAIEVSTDGVSGEAVEAVDCLKRVRFDAPGPGQFSEVFLSKPEANFASVNAGDYNLYVGGQAINRAFREALESCGHNPKDRYETLHEALLASAAEHPGKMCYLRPGDVFQKPNQPGAVVLRRCGYCGKRADCWEVGWSKWRGQQYCAECWRYYEEWIFGDTLSLSGLVPQGDQMEALHPVGLVSIAVFPKERRPCQNARNVAMVYVVGPNCGVRKKDKRAVPLNKDEFLQVLEKIGSAISHAVAGHNATAAAKNLPDVEILRMCLLSGGVYKHPNATKIEVAAALIRGLVELSEANASTTPVAPCILDFAFDEDVFREAWQQLQLPMPSS